MSSVKKTPDIYQWVDVDQQSPARSTGGELKKAVTVYYRGRDHEVTRQRCIIKGPGTRSKEAQITKHNLAVYLAPDFTPLVSPTPQSFPRDPQVSQML